MLDRTTDDYDMQVADWLQKEPDVKWLPHVRGLGIQLSGRRVLDCGCGAGKYARTLSEAGAEVFGADQELRCVRMASENNPGEQHFLNGNIEAMPIASGSFDLVLLRYVIHHISGPNRVVALREISRLLRARGELLIETAFHNQLIRHFDHQIYAPLRAVALQMYPDRSMLAQDLAAAGFAIEAEVEVARKKDAYTSVEAALENSRRLVASGRGPTTWLRLTRAQREEFHRKRQRDLPQLFPSGTVPREWWGVLIVARKRVV